MRMRTRSLLRRAAALAAVAAYFYAAPGRLSALLRRRVPALPPLAARLLGLQAASLPLVYLILHRCDQALLRKTGADKTIDGIGGRIGRIGGIGTRWRFWAVRKPAERLLGVYRRMGPLPARSVFENKTGRTSALQRLKMSLVGVTLFPLRAALLVSSALAMLGFSQIAVQFGDDAAPPTGVRRALQKCIYMTFRVIMLSMGFWRVRQRGRRATVSEAPIIVPNHSSFVDMCIGALFGATGVSKLANAKLPVLGPAFRAGQMILVDRASVSSRNDTKAELVRRATEPGWPQTVIFPEGTCSNNTEALLAFKAGPFTVGKPVQPVAVRYPNEHCDPSFVRGGPGLGYLLLRIMLQFRNDMVVTFLPPHVPTPTEIKHPLQFASAVGDALSKELGVPKSSFSYYDVALMDAARKKHGLPTLTSVPNFKSLRKECPSLTLEFAKDVMARFAAIGGSPGREEKKKKKTRPACRIVADDVLHLAGSGNTFRTTLVQLFKLADEEGCGDEKTGERCSLGYRQVLVLVCLLRAAAPGLDTELPADHVLRKEGLALCEEASGGVDGAAVAKTAYVLMMG